MLGQRAGVSRQIVSRIERGELAGLTLTSLTRVVAALGGSVSVQVRWHGEELDRLVDAAHAGLQRDAVSLLANLSWEVRAEVSFNHYGDRGRVDVLAFHRRARILLVVEVKSAIGDLQETLGRLDVKARLGRTIAADVGWPDPRIVLPAIVIGDTARARRVLAEHGPLFERYELRGRSARAWLRHPVGGPRGLLWFAKASNSRGLVTTRGQRAPNASRAHPV